MTLLLAKVGPNFFIEQDSARVYEPPLSEPMKAQGYAPAVAVRQEGVLELIARAANTPPASRAFIFPENHEELEQAKADTVRWCLWRLGLLVPEQP